VPVAVERVAIAVADSIMTFYIAREASKLWRKVCMETTVEVQLLMEKWKLLLAGLLFQYIHGLAARGVHYLHRPGPVLQDLGFMALPVCYTFYSFLFYPCYVVFVLLGRVIFLELMYYCCLVKIGTWAKQRVPQREPIHFYLPLFCPVDISSVCLS